MIIRAETDAFGFLRSGAAITILQNDSASDIWIVVNGDPFDIVFDGDDALIEVSPSKSASFNLVQENDGDFVIHPGGTLSIGKKSADGLYSLHGISSGNDSVMDLQLLALFNSIAERELNYAMNSMLLAALGLTSAASITAGAVMKVSGFTAEAKSQIQSVAAARTVNVV